MKPVSLAQWLAEGEFSLAFSSAFFGFFAHCGAARALTEAGVHASRLSGSSAGAIVAAGLASGLSHEDMREIFFSLRREDFWDPAPGLGLLKGEKFRRLLERHFVTDFTQTRTPLTVPVFDLRTLRTRFVSEGAVAPAVAASCAVPFLFRPVKVGGRPSLDGGMLEKAGMPPAPEGARSLCIFVQSSGLTGLYESKTSRQRFGVHQRALRFAALPRVLPHDLESGRRAYAEAYERTRAALRAPAQIGVQNA